MKFVASLLGVTLTLVVSHADALDYKVGALQITSPWSRATPKGAGVAAGYMKITNTGTTPDRLVGGSSPVAGRVEVHEMSMDGGVMKMRPLKDGLELKPGETVELKPGSFHIMMLDLKQAVKEGERVKGTLTFEKAGTVDVEYAVVAAGATPGGAKSGDDGMSGHDGMKGMPGMNH